MVARSRSSRVKAQDANSPQSVKQTKTHPQPGGDDSSLAYRKNGHDWNARALVLLLLFVLSASVRALAWIQRQAKGLEADRSWMDAMLLFIQFSTFILCLGHGLASIRLKPASSKTVRQGDAAKNSIISQKLAALRSCRLQVLIPCYTEALEVVQPTVLAAATADLPKGCTRTVWLLDDGNSKEKESWVASLGLPEVRYLSNRHRLTSEINGKAANLNHGLRHIYAEQRGALVDEKDAIAVLDCDQVCNPDFFTKLIPHLMESERVALVLSPQTCNNATPYADLPFNHTYKHFWEAKIPGFVCWGNLECTGTNFVARALPLQEIGWIPVDTTTEDTAMCLKLTIQNYQMVYVKEYLVIGQAPVGSAVFRQRSKWCKGVFQIALRQDPLLFHSRLPLISRFAIVLRMLFYFTAAIANPILCAHNILKVVCPGSPGISKAGIQETNKSPFNMFAYSVLAFGVGHYANSWPMLYSLCCINLSSGWYWYTFMKSIGNAFLAAMGLRAAGRFKATSKQSSVQPSIPKGQKPLAASSTAAKRDFKFKRRKEEFPWRDLWPYFIQLGACLVGFIYGMHKIVYGGMRHPGYILSVVTCVQFSLGPVLLLSYFWSGLPVTSILGWKATAAVVAFSLALTLARWVAMWT